MQTAVAIKEASSGLTVSEMAVTCDEREEKVGRTFEQSVEMFVSMAYKIVEAHYNREVDGTPRTHNRWGVKFTVNRGKRYVGIFLRTEIGRKDEEIGNDHRGPIYAFIDSLTGDVLKPATWKAPSKHARGNVFNENPAEFCGPYGMASLR